MAGLLSWGWAAPPNPTASGATVRSQREGDQTRVAGESPGVCSLADPVSAHGPCQVRGWGSRHLFQARQTACASRVTRTSNRGGPPGRAGKGRKHVGPCQAITRPSANDGIRSCGPESRAVFRGGEKGQPPPTPGPGALRGAGPGPRCLTLGDHGHPESPRRAQTSMLGSLRPGPAPQPPHAMRPGGLSTHLAACVPWRWARRAVRGGREQGVGSEGLGTRAPSSEQEAGERGRSGVRGGGPGGLRGS